MKTLKEKIQEGLKVNSKSKFSNYSRSKFGNDSNDKPMDEQIISLIWEDPRAIDKEEKEAIQNWVNIHNVKKIKVYITEDFSDMYFHAPLRKIIEDYESSNFTFITNDPTLYHIYKDLSSSKSVIYKDENANEDGDTTKYYEIDSKVIGYDVLGFYSPEAGYIFFKSV